MNPITIFAEGTTTNGTALIKFKRGAFAGMRTVIPCFITLSDSHYKPIFDTLPFWPMFWLMMSSLTFVHLKINIMPEFTPNEWMLNNHRKDENMEDWEVYAQCVREAISQQSGFTVDDTTCREKLIYEDFMCQKTDTITIKGHTFTYKEDRNGDDDDFLQASDGKTAPINLDDDGFKIMDNEASK